VLLLVTGASGAGKSTVRSLLQPALAPTTECLELAQLSSDPPAYTLAWRQQMAERAVSQANSLHQRGRHLLLCGDPVAAVEIAAVPSAPKLDGAAFCLLDVDAAAQAKRLAKRGDDPSLVVHHKAFADWMHQQAADPLHMLNVVSDNGWDQMRWDRIPALAPAWHVHIVDTTALQPPEVARAVLAWVRRVLSGQEPLIHPSN
jgi:energy-coupling factor transporter ATP-binding protein EcfA2